MECKTPSGETFMVVTSKNEGRFRNYPKIEQSTIVENIIEYCDSYGDTTINSKYPGCDKTQTIIDKIGRKYCIKHSLMKNGQYIYTTIAIYTKRQAMEILTDLFDSSQPTKIFH